MTKKSFIEEMKWRGMIHDLTPGLEEKLQAGAITGYIGFDPTAPSMTIGNYVQLMILKHFQLCGHKPIVLMGGATGRIGDPSGKDAERELKSYDELDKNLAHQVEQVRRLLDFDGPNAAVLLNNYDFYKEMNVLTFLRDLGKNLTINYMLSKDSVKNRMDVGMSFTEFSYQLLQAYDYLCLYRQQGCVLQMGGSDQWGNITSGTEFIRRNEPGSEVFALTTPLLTKADGKKFGKSEEGNIWLDAEMTTPYKFYQFWLNVDDRDLHKLFRFFSLLEKDEIELLETDFGHDPKTLKAILGEELTIRIHGINGFNVALAESSKYFNPATKRNFLEAFTSTELESSLDNIPSFGLYKRLYTDCPIVDLLSKHTRIFKSTSEARKAIEQNSISINGVKLTKIDIKLTDSLIIDGKFTLIEFGKKSKYLIFYASTYAELINFLARTQNIFVQNVFLLDENDDRHNFYYGLFEYYQENLFRSHQFGAAPYYFYFTNNNEIAASARKTKGSSFIINISKGLVDHFYNKFNAYFSFVGIKNLMQYDYLEAKLENTIGELISQLAIQFTFYHEFAHLIQFSDKLDDEKIESLNSEMPYSFDSHLKEIDADLFSTITLGSHVLQYLLRHDIYDLGEKGITMLLGVASSSMFIFFLYLDKDEEIYIKEKSHPHPFIRLMNVASQLVDSTQHFLIKKNINIQLDKEKVYSGMLEIVESLVIYLFDESKMNNIKERYRGRFPEINEYVNLIITKLKNDKYSALNVRNKLVNQEII